VDPWDWPGAHWWRCDLHLHTPASHDFRDPDATAGDWVGAAINAGLDVVAVTDHDCAAFINEVQGDPRVISGELSVFPGVELTSIEGVHLLVLLDCNASDDDVKSILGGCGIQGSQWGKADARASKSYSECMEVASEHGAICIAPHADAIPTPGNTCKASLLVGISDNANLELALSSPHLAAAEICESDDARHEKLRGTNSKRRQPGLSLLRFSDAHAIEQIGQHSTWMKMTRPDLEGLRLAFTDGNRSAREHDEDLDPNHPPDHVIESFEVSEAKHVGRSEPFAVRLNPWLNALIGGRGTGKSSLVELTRLVLGRNRNLPSGVQETHDNFARVYRNRREAGALTENTRIAIVYRKEGTRFRATWTQGADDPALEEDDDGSWKAADGSVRRRLPVQIYSQNEINEVAKDPRALLSIVNDSAEVSYDRWSAANASRLANFLALRASARDLQTSLSEEQETRGELADTKRQLAAFEGTEHEKILKDYERFQKQARAIDRWERNAAEAATALREGLEQLHIDPLPTDLFDSNDAADRSVLDSVAERETRVGAILEKVNSSVAELESEAHGLEEAIKDSAWSAARKKVDEEYRALATRLEVVEVGDPSHFRTLIAKREELEEQLGEIDGFRIECDETSTKAEEALKELANARDELSKVRTNFLDSVLEGNTLVRVQLDPMGDRSDAEDSLKESLGTGDSFGDDIANFVNMIYDSESTVVEGLAAAKKVIKELAEGGETNYEAADRRFLTRVRKIAPEAVDRIDAWFPEDLLRAEYSTKGGSFEPIDQGSAGQQNAAILAFLLSYGSEPIVIDQPENDLDNRLISALVVRSLIESKKRRQLVVVTHNPNLVVNADAEFVVSLDIPSGEVRVQESGGLQEGAVREEICEVMEGGREAFELRYSRIGRQSTV
jgi:hypothetical protein